MKKNEKKEIKRASEGSYPLLRQEHVTAGDCREVGDYCPWYGVNSADRRGPDEAIEGGRTFTLIKDGLRDCWVLTNQKSLRLVFSKFAADELKEKSNMKLGYEVAVDDEGLLFKFTSVQKVTETLNPERVVQHRDVRELRVVQRDGDDVNTDRWGDWGYAASANY